MIRQFALGAAVVLFAAPAGAVKPEAGSSSAARGAAAIGAVRRETSPAGTVARAAREGFWSSSTPAVPRSLGQVLRSPAPQSLPRGLSIPGHNPSASIVGDAPLKLDGQRGHVELLPEPPEMNSDEPLPSNPDARYFELPPAPE